MAALEPGAPLPSERELAERYGLARMTVRGEIDRLVAEGAVYRLHGRGTFVAEPRVAQAMAFSSFSEDMRARGMKPGVDRALARAGRGGRLPRAIARGRPRRPRLSAIDRVRTADGAPMAIEQAYLPPRAYPGVEASTWRRARCSTCWRALRRAPARGGAARRGGGHRGRGGRLLGVDAGEPGLRFHTVARDAEGAPVFYAMSLFRGDRYEIELRQTREEE